MKGTLLLAEAATTHPDGTVSVLRAGITHVWAQVAPMQFQGMIVVRFVSDIGDQGPHSFDLRCFDEDGGSVLPPLQAISRRRKAAAR